MSEAKEFLGKVVLITGGARNIGRELAAMFSSAGASVVVNSRLARSEPDETIAHANTVGAASGGRAMSCMGCIADITQAADAARLAQTAVDHHGRIDIFINGGWFPNS